ncbi:hypothetical protein ACFPM1_07745 [Halorubrum rubrum]|uniref:Uncharacterized protein n=1 Tax=Halorubrum rubrum TaxID=1126240 RepID=A0ABD5R166_9EURY|nr:hypothetical protein [Halorubrum rubrum]
MSDEPTNDGDESAAGTTEADYRWRWLSTIYAFAYGLGLPAWILTKGTADIGAVWSSALLLAWGSTVVYIVGPENVRAWQDLRGSGGKG